jgi:hypothetical protein
MPPDEPRIEVPPAHTVEAGLQVPPARTSGTNVPCPACGAAPGQSCHAIGRGERLRITHRTRREAADRV